jgi:flagellar hook-associated protein 3 FlgL
VRITESRMMELAASQVADARDKAAQAQQALSSGVRVGQPSDDPAAWADGQRAAIRQTMSQGRGQAISMAVSSLQQTDSMLSQASSSLTQLGALGTQGANGTLDAISRQGIAIQVRSLKEVAIDALNQQGPDGSYLLSGSKGNVAAFSPAGVYQGDGTARNLPVAEAGSAPGAVTGQDLTTANGGVDVLGVFDTLATALDANDVPGIQAALGTIQQAIGQLSTLHTQVGSRLTALQSADDARQSFELNLTNQHAAAVEADPVAAASDLTRASTVLQSSQAAAQHIIAMLQPT